MTHGSLFAGVGGFDLGFKWAGIRTLWQVEIDDYCTKVLGRRFPGVGVYADVRDLRPEDLPAVDIITGGFPCQPVSIAGRHRGEGDHRWLWPEMLRIVAGRRPALVVAENPLGLVSLEGGRLLDKICADLESAAYEVLTPIVLPACAFGAPYRRERVFILAHDEKQPFGAGLCESESPAQRRGRLGNFPDEAEWPVRADAQGGGVQGSGADRLKVSQAQAGAVLSRRDDPADGRHHWSTEPAVVRLVSRVPCRVDRIRGLGNAVVPQVGEYIARQLLKGR